MVAACFDATYVLLHYKNRRRPPKANQQQEANYAGSSSPINIPGAFLVTCTTFGRGSGIDIGAYCVTALALSDDRRWRIRDRADGRSSTSASSHTHVALLVGFEVSFNDQRDRRAFVHVQCRRHRSLSAGWGSVLRAVELRRPNNDLHLEARG